MNYEIDERNSINDKDISQNPIGRSCVEWKKLITQN